MADISDLRRILNDTPASATDVDYNFQLLESYLDTDVVQADGSTAMTGALVLPGAPTADTHAATKAYVDNAPVPEDSYRTYGLSTQIVCPGGVSSYVDSMSTTGYGSLNPPCTESGGIITLNWDGHCRLDYSGTIGGISGATSTVPRYSEVRVTAKDPGGSELTEKGTKQTMAVWLGTPSALVQAASWSSSVVFEVENGTELKVWFDAGPDGIGECWLLGGTISIQKLAGS